MSTRSGTSATTTRKRRGAARGRAVLRVGASRRSSWAVRPDAGPPARGGAARPRPSRRRDRAGPGLGREDRLAGGRARPGTVAGPRRPKDRARAAPAVRTRRRRPRGAPRGARRRRARRARRRSAPGGGRLVGRTAWRPTPSSRSSLPGGASPARGQPSSSRAAARESSLVLPPARWAMRGREALVVELDGHVDPAREPLGERARLRGLVGVPARQGQRQARPRRAPPPGRARARRAARGPASPRAGAPARSA